MHRETITVILVVVSDFLFSELKKPAIHIFFPKSTFINFSKVKNVCHVFSKYGTDLNFFPGGHPRRSGVTLHVTQASSVAMYMYVSNVL